MSKKAIIILLTIVVVLAATVVLRISMGDSKTDQRRQNVPLVKVEKPQRETITYTLNFTGDVLAGQQANIYSKVGGTLERVLVDMGEYVRQGQLLAMIDTTELSQQYLQASATYQNASINYKRTKELSEQNLVSKQDLDNSEAAVRVAKANYETAKIRLGYASIVAPFGGIITKRFLDAGALVNAGSITLFSLMSLDVVKVFVNVLEKDIPLITFGKKAKIFCDAYPQKEFNGSVSRLSQAVDVSTRTMAVEITIPNPEHMLKPGMFVAVSLIIGERANCITVPTMALLKDEKGAFVFIVNGDKALRRDIVIGREQGSNTEILSGLDGSENVVTVGQQFVKDGVAVMVQK